MDDEKDIASMSSVELRAAVHDLRKARDTARPNGTALKPSKIEFANWLLAEKNLDAEDFATYSEAGKQTLRGEFEAYRAKQKRESEVAKAVPSVVLPTGGESWPPQRRILFANLVSMGATDDDFRRNNFDPPAKA